MGELFPTDIRATSCGIVMAMQKVTLVANYKFFTIAAASFGFHYVLYFYAFIIALMAMWGLLTIKNTDHLSLTEIQGKLKKKDTEDEDRMSLLNKDHLQYDSLK